MNVRFVTRALPSLITIKSGVTILIATLFLSACSIDRTPNTKRKHIPDLTQTEGDPVIAAAKMPDYENPIFQPSEQLACDALNELSKKSSASRFSIFKYLTIADSKLVGAIELTENPLVQNYLADQFVVPDNKQFWQVVEAKHKAGLMGDLEYSAIKAATATETTWTIAKFMGVNKELAATLPGIFGEPTDVSRSLPMLLAKKMGFSAPTEPTLRALVSSTPLLADTFANLKTDIYQSVKAAIKSSYLEPNQDPAFQTNESICALVLWQRLFAQLLRIKGHNYPDVVDVDKEDKGKPPYLQKKLKELGSDRPVFTKREHLGAFFDIKAAKQIALSSEIIQSYTPSENKIILKFAEQNEAANLSENLALLEALVTVYSVTSPAAPLKPNLHETFLGDIKSQNNRAILPPEMHKLSLGLLMVLFKNLAAENVKQVTAEGLLAKSDKEVSGAYLIDQETENPNSHQPGNKIMRLKDILSMIRAAVRLEHAVKLLAPEKHAEWAKIDPMYTVDKSKTPEINLIKTLNEKLVTVVKKLYFSLAVTAIRMAQGDAKADAAVDSQVDAETNAKSAAACVSEYLWDSQTGKLAATATPCTPDLLAEYKETLTELALAAKSPALYRRVK